MMGIRVVLEQGRQQQLIETVKEKSRLTWKRLAEKLNCGEQYLSYELRNEKRTLSKEMYTQLCIFGREKFDEFIVSEPDRNWGQIKGGKSVINRTTLFTEIKPRLLCKTSPQLAEIIGIMIGDGSIYTVPEKSIYQVHVAGNKKDEKHYMLCYVKPLFESVFNITMNIKETKTGLYVWKQSKSLVFTLNKHCLPSGNKMKNGIKIPSWIMSNDAYLRNCLRGIFDTDGCVYPKNKTNLYPTIWISSAVQSLRPSLSDGCKQLGFNLSSWRNSRNDAYIDRKKEVFRFFSEIGFKNQKHLIRWSRFNKLPSSSPVRP